MHPINISAQMLPERWHEAAAQKISTTERMKLFNDTEKVSYQRMLDQEKKELREKFNKVFFNESDKENLVEWIVCHTGYAENKKMILSGAYPTLHSLSNLLLQESDPGALAMIDFLLREAYPNAFNSSVDPQRSQESNSDVIDFRLRAKYPNLRNLYFSETKESALAIIDSLSLQRIQSKQNATPGFDELETYWKQTLEKLNPKYTPKPINFYKFISSKDLLAMRGVSKKNKMSALCEIVERFNLGMLPKFSRFKNIDHIIRCLGESSAFIRQLNLKDVRGFGGINDEDIGKISQFFTKLECLNLNYSKITNASTSFLGGMHALTNLSLFSCTSLTEAVFLKTMTNLTTLNCANAIYLKIEEVNFPCDTITTLNLNDNSLKSLNILQCFTNLTNLSLSNSQIPDNEFSNLTKCTNLISLDLSYFAQLQNLEFVKICTKINNLKLKDCNQVNNFNDLQACAKLTFLSLAKCGQKKELSWLTAFTNLTVDISGCAISKNDAALLWRCENIKLVFANSYPITYD